MEHKTSGKLKNYFMIIIITIVQKHNLKISISKFGKMISVQIQVLLSMLK